MTCRCITLLCLVTTLLLGGCSDYALHLLPPTGTTPISGGSTHTPPPANSSGWGSLEPGSFPEALFAAVWNDPQDACLDCWILNRYEQPRYDILDSDGNVAVRFELPWEGAAVYPRSIQPAGPGRFLAVSTVVEGGSGTEVAWFGDGQDGDVDVVLEWNRNEREIYVPGTGQVLELPAAFNEARVVPDPQDPDRLYLLARLASTTEPLFQARLYSIDVRSIEEPILEWYPEDMLPDEFQNRSEGNPWYPWFLDVFENGGETLIVVGVWGIAPLEQNYLSFLVGFSPESGAEGWELDLSDTGVVLDDNYGRQLSIRPPLGEEPGQAVLHSSESNSSLCHDPGFTTWDGSESVHVESAEGLGCVRIGPLLEPSTSTFLYYGSEPQADLEAQERLVISHQGQDVWSYTSFRDGLIDRPFDIHEVVSLELLSD